MTTLGKCPRCGAELPSSSLDGLCPKCVAQVVLAGVTDTPSQVPTQVQESGDRGQEPEIRGQESAAAAHASRLSIRSLGVYEFIRPLGQGGMGEVFEAQHRPTDRRVALKILNHSLDSTEARKRFWRERGLAASINHLNGVLHRDIKLTDQSPVQFSILAGLEGIHGGRDLLNLLLDFRPACRWQN